MAWMFATLILLLGNELLAPARISSSQEYDAGIHEPSTEGRRIRVRRLSEANLASHVGLPPYQHPWAALQNLRSRLHRAPCQGVNYRRTPNYEGTYQSYDPSGSKYHQTVVGATPLLPTKYLSAPLSEYKQESWERGQEAMPYLDAGLNYSYFRGTEGGSDNWQYRTLQSRVAEGPLRSEFGFPGLSEWPQLKDHHGAYGTRPLVCGCDRYRTIDGSCNNLRQPTWGMANTTFVRIRPAKYADGVMQPPVSASGRALPNARLVSLVLFPDKDIKDPDFTLVAMQYGQLVTHDMAMTLGRSQARSLYFNCCTEDKSGPLPQELQDTGCFPVVMTHNDPVYSRYHQQCMEFVRSLSDVAAGWFVPPFKAADQISATTHFLDASMVYGSTLEVASSLREFFGGLLRTEVRQGKAYPPAVANKTAVCDRVSQDEACYLAGDIRVNQNPGLTILQIALMREHNRVAGILQQLNPHWQDERLYQESRRIVIAEHQHISYYEWLPIFIGLEHARAHRLLREGQGYTHDYDDTVNPSVINCHTTAAARFYHSNIAGMLYLFSEFRRPHCPLRLSDHYNRPDVLEQGDNFDDLVRGLVTQPQQAASQFVTTEVTKFLFKGGNELGDDLRAFDVQRGRDHGLASYNDMRQYCGLPKAERFRDFADYISPQNVEELSKLYEHPDDVDYVVGGSLEEHVNGALVGPSFLCVITEQFHRTRVGDRFFFESGDHPYSLTEAQLAEIRKSSISRLLCDNGHDIFAMQPRGFQRISPENEVVPCQRTDAIPVVDLEAWREIPLQ